MNRGKARVGKGGFRSQKNTSKGMDKQSVVIGGELLCWRQFGKQLENRYKR